MESKERIRIKAQELYLRLGIRSVSMDDIATHLGMSKKTIYQFFSDKDQLVDAVVDGEIIRMQEDCVSCSINARNAIDEIFLTMEMVKGQLRNMNPMVLHDLMKFHHRSYLKFKVYKDEFLGNIVSNNIKRGIGEGFYRQELNIEILSRYRMESMMMTFNLELFPHTRFDLMEVTNALLEHFVYGLATAKGHQLIAVYKEEFQKNQLKNEK